MSARRVVAGMALAALCAACTSKTTPVAPRGRPAAAAAVTDSGPASRSCVWNRSNAAGADALIHNRYTLSPHPTVTLPVNLTWREDPFRDLDWVLQFQSLRWTVPLLVAWKKTRDQRYLARFEAILRDWLRDNGDRAAAAPGAWDDHSTAWRAMTLACAYETLHAGWIRAALERHGRVLAAPGFYVGHSNHALNQDIGLLAAGCALGRLAWADLAARRIDRLAAESIDAQGATNEQAVGYEAYNYARYTEAVARLRRCGRAVPRRLSTRLALMPSFLAQGTMPNGRYEPIGDSEARPADVISGTEAAFAASLGRLGVRPAADSAVYDTGYAFGRTGWGETRRFSDEIFYSMRWGPGRAIHGHSDGTAVTLYGYGSRLLLDPGKYSYDNNRWREYFQGPSAHNLVTIDGAAFDPHAGSELVASESTDACDFLVTRSHAWSEVTTERRVLFSRALGFMVVEDVIRAAQPVLARQLWHLSPDADPVVDGATVGTRRQRGNVTLIWLGAVPSIGVAHEHTAPIQGWVSYAWRQRVAAPVVEASQRGTTIRYLTLIVPSAARAAVAVRRLTIGDDDVRMDLTVDGVTERVHIAAAHGEVGSSAGSTGGLRPF